MAALLSAAIIGVALGNTPLGSTKNATDAPCDLPVCQNPCAPYNGGAYTCNEGDLICEGFVDCSGCYAIFKDQNGREMECTTGSTVETTPCTPPACPNPCSEFDSNSIYCEGYPNAVCTSNSDCNSCWAEYYDANGNAIECIETNTEPETTPCILPPCANLCGEFESFLEGT